MKMVLITLKVYILWSILRIGIFSPALMQPSKRPEANCGQRVDFFAIAHKLLWISISFHTGLQPLVRPSKCSPSHCWKTFSKKVFKGHSKRPKVKVSVWHLPIRISKKFCTFRILRYGFPIEISMTELFRHFYFWPLSNGQQNAFLTDFALEPLLGPVWSWKTILRYGLNWL